MSNFFCNCRQTMLIQLALTLRRQSKIRLTLSLTSIHRLALTPTKHIHRTQGTTIQLHTHRIHRATIQLHTTPVRLTLTQLQAPLPMNIMECRCLPCLMKRLATRAMCRRCNMYASGADCLKTCDGAAGAGHQNRTTLNLCGNTTQQLACCCQP